MDILDKLHTIASIRQSVLFGLEFDATDGDMARARKAFEEETKVLHEIAKHLYAEKGNARCKDTSCPHYALGQENGCTVYPDITICVDSNKGA